MKYNPIKQCFISSETQTYEITESMNSYTPKWLEYHDLPESSLLFHYTDLKGLKGILKNRSLWFGHISSFNDPLEMHYGKNLVLDVLDEKMVKQKSEYVREYIRFLMVMVNSFNEMLDHVYISCFCEDDNLLSQWRGYSSQGGGYSLGFKLSRNSRLTSDIDNKDYFKHPLLRKVIYNKEEQEDVVNNYVDNLIDGVKQFIERTNVEISKEDSLNMAKESANLLFEMIVTFKHKAFEVEREWRLIITEDLLPKYDNLEFREVGEYLVPYKSIILFDEYKENHYLFPLKVIRVGPSLEPSRTMPAIELYKNYMTTIDNTVKLFPEILINSSGYKFRRY